MNSIIENNKNIITNITSTNSLMLQAYKEYLIGRINMASMLKALQLHQTMANMFLKEVDLNFDDCKEYFCTFENDTFNRPEIELNPEQLDMIEKMYSDLNN